MTQQTIRIVFSVDEGKQCGQDSHWVKPHYRRGKEVAGFCRKSRGKKAVNNQITGKKAKIETKISEKQINYYKSIMINLFGKEKLGGEKLDIELNALGGKKGEYKHPPGVTEKSDYEITYAITELSDLITSHQPGKQFGVDERFPTGIQDRDYTKKAEQSKVIDIASKIDPAFMLSEAVSAAEGPPIVTKDGIVLSGNGRTMGLKLTSADFPQSAEKYHEKLKRQAVKYGFKKTDLENYEFPVLTRIIDIDSRSKEAVNFGIAANAKIGASRSEIREAAAFANNLPDTLMNEVRDADDTTMSKILEQKSITDFIRSNIPVKDQQTFINQTTNRITDSGKALIKRIMLINALGKPETLENMTPKQYRTFESMLPVLIDLSQKQKKGKIDKTFNISKIIEDSLEFYQKNITGRDYNSYQHYIEQAELFEEKVKPTPEVEAFIKKFEQYEKKPTDVKNYVKNLIKNSVEETHFSGGLLGVKPKTFTEIIETSEPLKQEPKESAMFAPTIKIKFSFDESKHPRDSSGKFSKSGEKVSKTQRRITAGEEMVRNPPGETSTIPDVGGGIKQFFINKLYRLFSVYNDQKRFRETAESVKTSKKKDSKEQETIDKTEEELETRRKAGKYNPDFSKFKFLEAGSTIKIKFQADSGKVWVKEHTRRGKTVAGHWRVRRGGTSQPKTGKRREATPIGIGAEQKKKETEKKPVETSEKMKKVLSKLAGLKKLREGLTERETAFKAEFDTNTAKLEALLPEAKGRFKTWVNKSITANQKASKQIESGEISELKAAQVQGIMMNFTNILKANKEFKEKPKTDEKT